MRPLGIHRHRSTGTDLDGARRPGITVVLAVAVLLVLAVALPQSPRSRARGSAPPHAARATTVASTRPVSTHPIVATADDAATGGYWLVASDGGVFAFGAPFLGSAGALPLVSPVVGATAPADGGGYWLVASDGGVFSYGNAAFFGSMGGTPLNRPIVGMAATPDGRGYWLVASDGGIFSFGDATFYGSMGGTPLNRPIVGMAATPDGRGYWLVASDGGIFSFGDATFYGSMGGTSLVAPVVAMEASGGGYRLLAADGGVFCFHASFGGSASGILTDAAVALSTGGTGYRIVAANGGVFAYGGAQYLGSVQVLPLAGRTVAIDPGHDGGNASDPGFINQPVDGGGFLEPCDTVGTQTAAGYSEHAFNFDVAQRLAAILQSEGATVILTRHNDTGVGPCVPTRAAIGNAAGADAAISIHADGGPVDGRGFQVIEPIGVVSTVSDNRAIVPASEQLGAQIRASLAAATGEGPSTYAGTNGIVQRGDLGGLNLSTVPKVLVECANMQNPSDAALTESPSWRQLAADGLAAGLTAYLEGTGTH